MRAVERDAAHVLVAGYVGDAPPPSLTRLPLGGVILFSRNLGESLEETAARVEAIERSLRDPALVAIDQEGGRVARLRDPFLRLPPMRALGIIDDVALTERVGGALGRGLSSLGFGVDFAPVLDVDTNPDNPVIGDRSFGADPETVTRHGLALARGLGSAGVVACAKHFPGHGDTDLDSHLALPVLRHARERLDAVELAPFRTAAAAGVPTIMTAHVVFESLDAAVPATLSRRVVSDLLRGEMGYRGVIVSDDLEMKAVADRWGVAESAVQAIEAGCDVLLVCKLEENVLAAHEALVMRAERDAEFAARLADAARRADALPRLSAERPPLDLAALRALERELDARVT